MEESEVIFVKVDPSCAGQGHGRRATLCENLLGFIPGHFLPGDNRIMVAGTSETETKRQRCDFHTPV